MPRYTYLGPEARRELAEVVREVLGDLDNDRPRNRRRRSWDCPQSFVAYSTGGITAASATTLGEGTVKHLYRDQTAGTLKSLTDNGTTTGTTITSTVYNTTATVPGSTEAIWINEDRHGELFVQPQMGTPANVTSAGAWTMPGQQGYSASSTDSGAWAKTITWNDNGWGVGSVSAATTLGSSGGRNFGGLWIDGVSQPGIYRFSASIVYSMDTVSGSTFRVEMYILFSTTTGLAITQDLATARTVALSSGGGFNFLIPASGAHMTNVGRRVLARLAVGGGSTGITCSLTGDTIGDFGHFHAVFVGPTESTTGLLY